MGDNTARSQFTFYESFFKAVSRIKKKADRADAYDILCAYALYGQEPDMENLPDAVAISFEVIRPNLDAARRKAQGGKKGKTQQKDNDKIPESSPEDNGKMPERCVEQGENDNKKKDKNKNKIKNKCYESPYPLFARMAELVPDGVLGSALRTKLDEWMTYKHQRREDYTEQGLTALVSRLQKAQAEFGEDSVCDLITECMASNWQGIIFDKLSDRKAGDTRRPAAGNAGKVQSGYYGGQTVASDWSRAAVARMMENGGDPE